MVTDKIAGWIAHTDEAWWGMGSTPTEAWRDAKAQLRGTKAERKTEMARMQLSPATPLAWEWCEAVEGDFRDWRILPNGWFDASEEKYWLEEEFAEERAEIGEQLELRYFWPKLVDVVDNRPLPISDGRIPENPKQEIRNV